MSCAAHLAVPDVAVAKIIPLNAIPAAWDKDWADLARHASEPNPFAECWFMRPAICHLATTADSRMIAVWQGELLLGLLPLVLSPKYGRLPVRHVQNWVHYHCFYGAPLVRAGQEHMFWAAALTLLDGESWASNFLHIAGLDPNGPVITSLRDIRHADIVHRSARALLRSNLGPEDYYAANVRPKKRKEIRRLRTRLDELGTVEFTSLEADGSVDRWINDFLTLEASGWKGREGSALSGTAPTKSFFEAAVRGAHRVGTLEMLRLTLDGKVIAMLINFMTPPGGFAFKIAFDEDYARFSPGVLIKIENLKVLGRPDIEWMDSCAVEDHPMINSLWVERREIVRVTVPLAGARRKAVFRGARLLERTAAWVRGQR